MCIYIYIYIYIKQHICVQTVYELPLLANNTAVKHIYTNRSGAKCWLDIYHWGAGLAVTGPIRDIGQNVLQYSFEQEVVAAQLLPRFVPYRTHLGGLYYKHNNYTMLYSYIYIYIYIYIVYIYIYIYIFFLLWRCDLTRVMASSFLRFLDHTQRRNTVGRTPLDEWSARRRDLYLTTHNTHNRQTSMPPVGFEPTISAGERRQTYALDRAVTETGMLYLQYVLIILINHNVIINTNWGRLQDILLFRIPMGTRKNSFEMYRQFGHDAPSKRLASLATVSYT